MKLEEIKKLRKLGKSYGEIGKIYNVSRQRIHQFLGGIEGGRDIIREKIRARDNYTCQICNKKWESGERKLDVHHIDCDSNKTKMVDSNEPWDNLITLCHKCHLNIPEHKEKIRLGRC